MSNNDSVSEKDLSYEAYIDERKEMVSASLSVSERLDKWIIGLPAGLAVFSLLFYEKIIGKSTAEIPLIYLILAWSCLCFAVGTGFFSLYGSTKAVYRQIEILDFEYDNNGNKEEEANGWTLTTRIANVFSVVASLIALVMMIFFTTNAAEIINKEKKSKEQTSNKSMKNEDKPMKKGAGYVPPKTSAKPPKTNSQPSKPPKQQ